jgi:hypothetical protein
LTGLQFRHRAPIPRVVGRRYRMETWVYSYNTNAHFQFAAHDFSDQSFSNERFLGALSAPSTSGGAVAVAPPAPAFHHLATEFVMDAGHQAFVRPFVYVLSSDGQPIANPIHIGGIRITDVTDSNAALVNAQASSVNATSAAASDTAAGQKASAADTSAQIATTRAGEASVHRDAAAVSEQSAAGSVVQASNLVQVAAASETAAANNAAASVTAAGVATTKAGEAGVSATAAEQEKIAAQAANGGAQAQAGVAAERAAVADAAAAAAVESRNLTATYRAEAVTARDAAIVAKDVSVASAGVSTSAATAADGHRATAEMASTLSAQYRDQAQGFRNDAAGQVISAQALVTQEANVRAGETYALGQRIGTTEANVGDLSARTGIVEQSVVDVSAQTAAARLTLEAVSPGGRAYFSLFSSSAIGAKWALGGDGEIDGNLTVNGTIVARKFDRASMSRVATSSFSGSITPALGQTVSVPWSLALGVLPPLGRFIYEMAVAVTTNAGQQNVTTYNGKPLYTNFIADGGLALGASDAQGNGYGPRPNSSDPVLATTDFNAVFSASVVRGSADSGIIDDGDYYYRDVSATYTLTQIYLRVTWVAV